MKLLFIDDEQTFLKYLAKRMALEGFEVKTTFSGEEGVAAAAKAPFDVAVVDLQMPGIDGIEVQKLLKDLQPDLPCIVLTGHGSVENALESGKYNAFKFLSKPVDMDTLIQTIQAAYDHRVEKQSKQDPPDTSPAAKGPVSKLFQKFRHLYGVEK
ncbi:response regulator [Desulfotignum phosphitoxidans]|uniref:Response regulator receiver domain-containing protein n=1 Tax=Desulfotignum phosphitoxidans DSM 13687 TaxID=1286635 RepID=S0G6D6_9BACT|nr:response regulator [Desulfotignum phosphitoxidans]EMS80001.1 response regulator receiver domain-containing protein [Desulfotignum phosphitoxidans DSM 13687]